MKFRYLPLLMLQVVATDSFAQDRASFNEQEISIDSLIKVRSQSITTFYILLNQKEEVSSNEMSVLLDLEDEWAFVDSVLSPEQQETYYDADWDDNSSPVMERLRRLKNKLQLYETILDENFPEFSIRPDFDDTDILYVSFVSKGKLLDIKFVFYTHQIEKIKAIILPNGNDALELIKSN